MRAIEFAQFGPVETASLVEKADPVPRRGEVIVAVHAAPVNFVDSLVVTGAYQFLPELPFTPGKGPAGVVCATGPEVEHLHVGDRVLAMAEQGGYAEKVVVAADQCYPLPQGLSFVQAAAMGVAFDTAWCALRDRARLQPGETVLVLGASGAVGIAAVQLAKAMGARVIAAIARKQKSGMVRRAGADAVVDLSAANLRDSLRAQVYDLTDGRGADIVLDPLGGDAFDAALRTVAWRGRLVVIGFASGRIPAMKMNYLLLKNIEISGLQISDYRKRRPDMMADCYAELFDWFAAGRLVPLEVETYPLERAVEAMAAVRDRRARGRVVLAIRES
jgi:NADPH2:quinone reductase